MRTYWIVVVQYEEGGSWHLEFGDYSRGLCLDEAENMRDNFPTCKTKVKKTKDDQQYIDKCVRDLNERKAVKP